MSVAALESLEVLDFEPDRACESLIHGRSGHALAAAWLMVPLCCGRPSELWCAQCRAVHLHYEREDFLYNRCVRCGADDADGTPTVRFEPLPGRAG